MKRTAALLCALLALALLCLPAAAEEEGGTVIDRYQAQCVVDGGGGASMTVTVDMTIPSPVTALDFPIGAGTGGAVDGQEAETVDTEDGTALRVSADAGLSGSRTFRITYRLPRAVSSDDEGQRLDLDLIAPGWQWPMQEAGFAVAMPSEFSESPVYTGGYYGDLVEDYMTLENDGRTFTGVFREPLRDHDSLSVTLALPAGYAQPARTGGISGTVALILVAAVGLLGAAYWYFTLRSPAAPVRLRPLPPDGVGAGDLPLLAGRGRGSLALQAMQWAAMGYLSVEVTAKDRIVLYQTMPMGNERRRHERAIFAKLFERDPWCDGEGVRFGRLAARYADMTRTLWTRRLYARDSGSPALLQGLAALAGGAALLGSASAGLPASPARGWLLALLTLLGIAGGVGTQLGVLAALRRDRRRMPLLALPVAFLAAGWLWGGMAAVLPALAIQVLAALAAQRGGRRSPSGRENLAQLLGFRRYLQHVTPRQLRAQLRQDSQFFYEMLPFAEALGQGRSFAERLSRTKIEPCAWLTTTRRAVGGAQEFYQQFCELLDRMESASRRAR